MLELISFEMGEFHYPASSRIVKISYLGVYGEAVRSYGEYLWEELDAVRGLWQDPWCIGCDFNVTSFPLEQSRLAQ